MHLGNPSASSEACYAAVMLSDTKRSFVPMMTHKDFWEGRVTRDQYCSSVAKAAGIDMSNSPLLPRVREAMARGDEQMSNITWEEWDRLLTLPVWKNIERALEEHDDVWSAQTALYVIRQAAKEAAQRTA